MTNVQRYQLMHPPMPYQEENESALQITQSIITCGHSILTTNNDWVAIERVNVQKACIRREARIKILKAARRDRLMAQNKGQNQAKQATRANLVEARQNKG